MPTGSDYAVRRDRPLPGRDQQSGLGVLIRQEPEFSVVNPAADETARAVIGEQQVMTGGVRGGAPAAGPGTEACPILIARTSSRSVAWRICQTPVSCSGACPDIISRRPGPAPGQAV